MLSVHVHIKWLHQALCARTIKVNRQRDIPVAVNRDENEISPSFSGNSLVSEKTEQLTFMILDATSKSFPKLNTVGRSFLIKFVSG